jgi:hypothetical protein
MACYCSSDTEKHYWALFYMNVKTHKQQQASYRTLAEELEVISYIGALMRTYLHVSLISISQNSTCNNQLQGTTNEQFYSRKYHYHMLQQWKWQTVTVNFVVLSHNSFILLFWIFMPQQRIKLMIWKMTSMRNWNVYSTNSLNKTWKFCWEI